MDVRKEAELWARAVGLPVCPFVAVPLTGEIVEGHLDPPRGSVSPHYGQRHPAPLLVCSAVAMLPIRLVTLLWPIEDTQAPLPAVRRLEGDGPDLDGLLLKGAQQRIRFDDPVFVVERG